MDFSAGQSWSYRAPEGFESSRIIIGAVVTFTGDQHILCCSITHAPRRRGDGSLEMVTIPFLPMSAEALRASVVALDSSPAEPPEHFCHAFEAWRSDPQGLTTFTVAFDGFLDRMIARQMADIVGQSAA